MVDLSARFLSLLPALTVAQLADGVSAGDPIAVAVIESAAHHTGLAIHGIVTIMNPAMIVLAGGMIKRIPLFGERVISYARRYSYELAWNRTKVVVSANEDRQLQTLGAFALLADSLAPGYH